MHYCLNRHRFTSGIVITINSWRVCLYLVPLDMKGCICHLVKWQIHPFMSKVTIYWSDLPQPSQIHQSSPGALTLMTPNRAAASGLVLCVLIFKGHDSWRLRFCVNSQRSGRAARHQQRAANQTQEEKKLGHLVIIIYSMPMGHHNFPGCECDVVMPALPKIP